MATKTKPTHQDVAHWAIAMEGKQLSDPNGNVTRLLHDRVVQLCKEHGVKPVVTYSTFSATLSNLNNKGIISKTRKHITLLKMPNGVNPFAGSALAIPEADGLGEMRSWSISRRAALMKQLAESIEEDLVTYKGVVMEGI